MSVTGHLMPGPDHLQLSQRLAAQSLERGPHFENPAQAWFIYAVGLTLICRHSDEIQTFSELFLNFHPRCCDKIEIV
jgi:hypothetical protein